MSLLSPTRRRKTRSKFYEDGVLYLPDGRQVCAGDAAGDREYRRRLWAMVERQGYCCAITGKAFTDYSEPTFDHEGGRGHGGGHRDDQIDVDGRWQNAALSLEANTLKGSKRYSWQQGEYLPIGGK